jgi:CBS domain-containing protein
MFVRNWMSSPAVVIPPVVPAAAALGFMEKRRIRRLPVVDGGKLLGIVTKSDLQSAMGIGRPSRRAADKSVEDVMTRKPVVVEPGQTLERAAEIMLERKISGLPVVQEGMVVGIITESDIFRALCDLMGVREKGARVVMTVGDDEDVLDAIAHRMNGLAMKSLATFHNVERGTWEVVARVRGRVPARA